MTRPVPPISRCRRHRSRHRSPSARPHHSAGGPAPADAASTPSAQSLHPPRIRRRLPNGLHAQLRSHLPPRGCPHPTLPVTVVQTSVPRGRRRCVAPSWYCPAPCRSPQSAGAWWTSTAITPTAPDIEDTGCARGGTDGDRSANAARVEKTWQLSACAEVLDPIRVAGTTSPTAPRRRRHRRPLAEILHSRGTTHQPHPHPGYDHQEITYDPLALSLCPVSVPNAGVLREAVGVFDQEYSMRRQGSLLE